MDWIFSHRNLAILSAFFIAAIFYGRLAMASNVETPQYDVVEKFPDFEVRQYTETIQARVVIAGPDRPGMSGGFRALAGYIFGGNQTEEKIAMTAPVATQLSEDQLWMTFTMPGSYSLEDLPVPNNASVELIEVPETTLAALQFSGWATQSKAQQMKEKLLGALQQAGLEVSAEPILAQYDPPSQLPMFRRNEILVPISLPKSGVASP